MKKILFLINSLAGGGAEKVLVNLVNHLDKSKYDITVQTLFDVGINKQYLSEGVHYKYTLKKVIRGNVYLFKLFNPEYLFSRIVKEKYDIIISFFQGPLTRIVAGCKTQDIVLIQWIHSEFHSKKEITRFYRSESECNRLQNKYAINVFVAKTAEEAYKSTFPKLLGETVVKYNVIETDRVRNDSNEAIVEKNLFSSEFNVISVGRLVPVKAYDRLIRVVSRLRNENGYDVSLTILGDGCERKQLIEIAENSSVSDYVNFLGYKDNPYKYVKSADLFVCSSHKEGFSTAITEALIVGTPVLTTDCSGMRELLGNNEYGLIVENSENALYEGLKKMIENKALYKKYKQMAIIRGSTFDVKKTIADVESMFDSL